MKSIIALTWILTLFSSTASAQDYTRWNLPEDATARVGKGSIHELKYSRDGTRLAVASSIGIWLYDTRAHEEIALFIGHTGVVNSVAFSSDGKMLASASDDTTVRLWDTMTGAHLRTLSGHRNEVLSVAFTPDGKTVASGSRDRSVRLWDTATGSPKNAIWKHQDLVWRVAFSPDGRTLATGSKDATVRL